MFDYTFFFEKCGQIEARFRCQDGLIPLKPFDASPLACESLLDFGCGKKLFAGRASRYVTCDSDASLDPDWAPLDDVASFEEPFDAVVANQVLEHIEFSELDDVVSRVSSVLKPGGKFLATIPNIRRGMYFFNDIDHKTPLTYYQLGALMELNDIRVIDAYRYMKKRLPCLDDPRVCDLTKMLHELYELDYAHFIAVLGQKES